MSFFKRTIWLLVITFILFIPTIHSLNAQYFGRNKVQYKEFDFKIMKTEHFDIYYYPAEREAAEQVSRLVERWYARLSNLLNHELSGRQALIMYANHPEFEQTNAVRGTLGESTGGVTESFKRRIVLPFGVSLSETDHVLGHELVHAFQFDITGQGNPGGRFASPAALRLPLWFIEGMAEYLSVGPTDAHTAMWMRDAAKRDKLPTIDQLLDPRFFPYRYGQALWAYIGGKWGSESVEQILKLAGQSRNQQLSLVFNDVLAQSQDSLSIEWHNALKEAVASMPSDTREPDNYGRLLMTSKKDEVGLNIAPVISPDGNQIVFLSARDLFSIDMFLADTRTGEIKRKIVKTSVDPHFESLQFINSAGTWNTEGTQFAFAAISKGIPVLSILDVSNGKIIREIKYSKLGEIFNPTWSPDDRYIAFSALVGGVTDLFIQDLKSDDLERVTNDPYADLHPAWSPNGKNIAYVTDRFSTNLKELKIGNYQIALLDPKTGESTLLNGFNIGKNINPQWSSDGNDLYFLSDNIGITNIYRMDIQTQEIFQVTNIFTGVSGITALSPALSTAGRAKVLAFSVFEAGKYNIYIADSPEILAGGSISSGTAEINPAFLPPKTRADDRLITLLNDDQYGLTDDGAFELSDYHTKLSLDYIGQPYLSVGSNSFGSFIGGGTSLFWSDMLGNHNLATSLQVNGGLKDIATLLSYQNTSRRLNWGIAVSQIPFVTRSFATGMANINGETAFVEQTILFRQINRQISGIITYPFNKAQRLEFSAGFTNISFDNKLETFAVSALTGSELIDATEDINNPDAIRLGQASLALVYDNSLFGATSPILGQRYRLEVSPFAGTISYSNILIDFRKYIMPVRPFTFAGRILHFGRYGADAEDTRLSSLFLGYPGLVRGYSAGSFTFDECNSSDCPTFNQLFGSKILVTNLELRFPLFGALKLGSGYYGIFPIEFTTFYDAGVAWNSVDKASFLGGDRNILSSAGVGIRTNLLGIAIFEIDYVRPFDRPGRGAVWQFSIIPGF